MPSTQEKRTINLKDFVKDILMMKASEIGDYLKSNPFIVRDLLSYCTWNKEHYTRNCLHRNQEKEVILLCWEPGQKTPIHNHNGQNCWVSQLQGSITENLYLVHNQKYDLTNSILLEEGKCSFINDEMGWHNLENNSKKRAVSLHIYVNPIEECEILNGEKTVSKKLEYDYDWAL